MSPLSCICPCPLPFPSPFWRSPQPSPAPNTPSVSELDVPDQGAVGGHRTRNATYPPTSGNPSHRQQPSNRTVESAPASLPVTSGIGPPNLVPPVTEQPTHPKPPSRQTGTIQTPPLPAVSKTLDALGSTSHESPHSQHPISTNQRLPQPRSPDQDIPSGTDIFSLKEGFVAASTDNETYNATRKNFMEDLLKETIPGAAFDSSSRDSPPRCHPGTRLAILRRCISFIVHCTGVQKILLVTGAAGVGKSAIMQSIAESPDLRDTPRASIFFSIIGRNDGSKAILTLSYQFAAKSEMYRGLIQDQVASDSSLLRSEISVQFMKLIVEPLGHHLRLRSADRIFIIIDGLDECNDSQAQQELLRLISNFCIAYPSSPVIWLIASRPEEHITTFFSQPSISGAYEKEEIPVDSDEARADVEKYIQDKLGKIQEEYKLGLDWPGKPTLWKLANASGGLFAYADTAVRYIGDRTIKRPADQLVVVLEVIDQNPMTNLPPEKHPMARLDALYKRILSKISPKSEVGKNSRILLLALASDWDWGLYSGTNSFLFLCNWLGMTNKDSYAVLNPLCSVFLVPSSEQAHKDAPRPFHKSIIDHLSDFNRSKFSHDIKNEAQKQRGRRALKISKQAPDGVDFGDVDYKFHYGTLARCPGAIDSISLTWRADRIQDDNELKLMMYKTAIGQVVSGIEHREQSFQNESCVRLLITRFQSYSNVFPYDRLRDLVFDEQRRDECVKSGILQTVPLEAIKSPNNDIKVKFRFRRLASSTATATCLSGWKSSCNEVHEQDFEAGEETDDEGWTTNLWRDCASCLERLQKQKNTLSTNHRVSILFTSTGECCVELDFVDPEDCDSKWTYWYWINLSLEERKKYGSIV